MNHGHASIRRAVLVPLGLSIALLVLAGVFGAWRLMTQETMREAAAGRERLRQDLERSMELEGRILSGTLDMLAASDRVELLASGDRARLHKLYGGIFDRLKNAFEVSHLYLLDADRRVILRLHEPAAFGDVLDRATLRQAEESGRETRGLDIGSFGNLNLRVVRPLELNGARVGYIELSKDEMRILPAAIDLLGGDFVLALHRATVEKRHISGDLGAVAGVPQNALESFVVRQSTLERIPPALLARMGADEPGEPFLLSFGDRDLTAALLDLHDAEDGIAGRVALLRDVTLRMEEMRTFCVGLAVAGVLLGLGLMLFIDRRVAQVEQRLGATTDSLRAEVEQRRRNQEALALATDEALAASRAKSEFLATMSHEIKTPLNGIIGFTDLTLDTDLGEEQRQNLRFVRDSAGALLAVINDVLDLARLEAGSMRITAAPFSPSALCAGVRELFAPEAARKGLSLSVDLVAGLPVSLLGDEARIRQVLVNLVGNAVKFTQRGGVRVLVSGQPLAAADASVREEGEVWRIAFCVEDSGPGIPEEHRERIFEPFTQSEATMTRRFGGTGLGLALVRRLTQLMGGEVALQSSSGAGASFCVTLPLARGGSEDAPQVSPPMPRRILVAEDNLVNQLLARKLLARLGREAVVAQDGQEALRLLAEGTFEAALLDLNMPRLDGLALARAVRAGQTGDPAMRLIGVSAQPERSVRAEVLAAGMDAYVEKPLSLARLTELLGGEGTNPAQG